MGSCGKLPSIARIAVFLLLVFEQVESAQSLRPGGKNVQTKYETYYVRVSTLTRQLSYRRTCRLTCPSFWWCSTRCRTVSQYRWVTAYRNQPKTRAVYECRQGWRANGDECTTPICTNVCQNNGTCTAPNTCNCTVGWIGSQCDRDFNECNSSSGFHDGCQQICVNFGGGYNCTCGKGYFLAANGKNCTDIDECNSSSGFHHGCQHMCVNFPGGFNCTCAKGHFLASNGKNCTDHDECAGNIHGCHQGCVNYPGGYNCSCKSGYRLNTSDLKSCDDLNECEEKISGCGQNCKNLIGGYNCSCNHGYYLGTDEKSCYDINECSRGVDGCEHNCVNTQGSYRCRCRPGFDLSSDGRHCIGRPCVRVETPVHGKMNCTGNTTEHVCYFMCFPGYELTGSKNRTCSAEKVWTGRETGCEIIHCPVPVAPRSGFVYSPCNTEFTSECIVGCERGYFLEGSNNISCDSSGAWKPNNAECKEIRACEPNPCQNGGICTPISSSRFTCNCSLTGYSGSKCDVGNIDTPQYPSFTRGVPSSSLQFECSPASDYVIVTPRSQGVAFEPEFLLFNTTSVKQSMTAVAQQRGLQFVEYTLSGPDAADFKPPQNDVVFVERAENTTGQTAESLRQHLKLPVGCYQLEMNKCPRTNNVIVYSSTSSWNTLGPMLSTRGVVTVGVGKTIVPLSLLGSTVYSQAPAMVAEHCGEYQENYSIEDLLRSQILAKSFLEAFQSSFPSWLVVSLAKVVKSEALYPSDLETYFLSGKKLRKTDVGKGQPLSDKTAISLLIYRNINLTVEGEGDILGSREYKSPFSLAVDLCSASPKNVIMHPSAKDVDLVNSISIVKRLKEDGWDFTFYSLQISKTKSIEKLRKGLYWNGEQFVGIDSSDKGNLAIVASLKKSFTNEDFVNCSMEFDGTMVIGVDHIDKILQSPLDQRWQVDLYGNSKLTMKLEVEGKKTNVIVNVPQSVSYATFGGSSQESTSTERSLPQGLYISHTLEECPFVRSELGNFVECSSNRTLSTVFYTKLQPKKKSNQSESGDKINGVSMAFRGNLKFGPLRFDDLNIELRMRNTELSIKGDYRETTPKQSGILKSAPLEPQLYISRVESGSSMGSFQSLVNFLGIEKRVNVSFSRNGLTFNVSGKLHGLYDAFIRFDSPLTSWESQTFVAAGKFVKKSDSLVEALDQALHAYGVDVFSRATRRVASFKLRKERAYTRLENTLAFEKTRRREMDKAREEYMTAERRLEAAKIVLKNVEGNVNARLKNLTSQLNKFCHMKECSDVCRKGMVCRNCNYNIAAESRETCLATCFKTEQRVITSNVSSVLCKTQDCTRIYLKSSLSKVNLRNTLASITKEVFSYAMKPTDFSLNNLPQAGTDARSTFFPGNTNEAVCTTQSRNVDGNLKSPVLSNPFQDTVMSNSNSERPCETDRRDGHWKCRVRFETCKKSESGFQYEYYQKPYACERLCEVYVSNETIPKSCCSTVPCAFSIVNVTCVAENALCHKIRIDALEKIPSSHNDSTEMVKNLESARANVSYREIMKRRAAIRLSSASNAFNVSEKAVRNLRKAYNITVQSEKNISNILAQPLRLKELVNKRLKSVEFVEFQSVKFNVKAEAMDKSALLPVRVMFKLNGSEEELSAVLNFRNFNASLRSIVKDILSMYMRGSTGKVRRKRSAEDTNSSFAEPSNRLKETNYLTVSTLQKYHKLCSEFTIYEQALYDIILSLYNITSESRQLVQEANIRNVSGLFDAIGILEKLIGNETIASKFGSETGKTAYLNSLETDPVLLGALDLQNEAAKDGFEPVNLTSKLLFRNWYSTMEIIFNVVLRNCSGFDDCVTYVLDGLTEIYEVTDLPGADNVRQQVREVRTNLVKLIESVDLSIDDAANISSNTLRILQDMPKAKLFCGRLPNITKHPEPLTEIGEAQTLVLSCNATGDFLVYKWRFNGNILDEQTTSVLLIRNTTPSQSGNYTCEVSNNISKETSSPALVIIHPPPSIILQPVDHLSAVVSVNESLQCVAESSDNSISYQWWFKSLDSTSYRSVANEIFSHLNFAPMEARHQGRYFCNVSNSFGYSISKTSFVKALYFTLPVPVATLSLSLTRKPGVNATFLQRTQTLPFAQMQLEISELLLVASGNVSNASKPQIKDLRITSCQLIKARDEQTRDIAEVCHWKFDYVGKNVTSNSSINDMFEANAQKVITSTRGINSAILRLVKGTNKGGLSFDAGSERYILEPHSLGVETFTLMCSPGQKLIKEDFRCVDCSPGFYGEMSADGAASCLPCPLGSHLNESGQTSCIKCPEGFTTVNEGSFHESDCQVICPAGHFGEISQNVGQCLECPLNTYQPKKGQFSCLKCPDGLVTTTKGAVDSSRCTFEPTEGQATGIQTSEPTGSRELTVTEATAVVERNVGDGTDMTSVIGGAVAGCVCLIGLLVLLFLLLMRKRRNAKRSHQRDDKDIVVPRCSVELKDWHENPAFSEDDDIPGNEAEDPKVESSNVSIVPSDGMSCENPIYEINPVNDCKPNDQEKPTDVSTGDDNIDLSPKMHKSYNDEASSSFRNPLYDAVKWKEKKKDNEPNR